jgi:hypothetical protein
LASPPRRQNEINRINFLIDPDQFSHEGKYCGRTLPNEFAKWAEIAKRAKRN